MEEGIKFFVGLDVHMESIAVGAAEAGRAPARLIGNISHDVPKLLKVLARHGEPRQVHVVYEAGPTGYGLQRQLAKHGYVCQVIAPALIPRRAGDRVKTDRRDCVRLAELARAGELRAVWVPDPADEAIRDLARAREDAVNACTRAKRQLKGFLLRHDVRYPVRNSWGKTLYHWLSTLNFGPGAQTAFTEYIQAVATCEERVVRLTDALVHSVEGWRFEPVVKALLALRGFDRINAIGVVAEVGDIGRFTHPRQLMGYLGLVPSERSSGERVARGSITKTGNAHARRLLTEAAWNYRFSPRVGPQAQQRAKGLPQSIRDLGWKAQVRLTGRFRRLQARGIHRNKVCVAIARELSGFVWAVARCADPQHA